MDWTVKIKLLKLKTTSYVERPKRIATIASEERLKRLLFMIHIDCCSFFSFEVIVNGVHILTIQNERGRKKIVRDMSSLTFSPSQSKIG